MNYYFKKSNRDHDSEIFITYYGATSHTVNSENNMTNLKDTETKVTTGEHKTLTGTKRGDWHGWQKRNGKLNNLTLTNMSILPGLHRNLFSVTQSLQKGFQLMS